MPQGADPVEAQQKQNPAHAGLTSFYLVFHENFELLGPNTVDARAVTARLALPSRPSVSSYDAYSVWVSKDCEHESSWLEPTKSL